jgi:hypothetical protein
MGLTLMKKLKKTIGEEVGHANFNEDIYEKILQF